jgi:hypothetical protein
MAQSLEDVLIEVIKGSGTVEDKRVLLHELGRQGPATNNRWTVRGVAISVGLIALAAPAYLLIFHAPSGSEAPQALISLSSTALGALAGFLTPRGRQD